MLRLFKWFVAVPIAALVTAALFLLVANQIAPEPFIYRSVEDDDKIIIDIRGAEEKYYIICHCHGVFPRRVDNSNAWTRSDKAVDEPPRVPEEKPVMPEIFEQDLHYCSGSREPLYRHISPLYPKACVQKRAEGAVLVQFDITAEGNVVNASIIESPDRCFNSTVLKLVSGWRYSAMCNTEGKPVARYDQQTVIRFQLEE